MSKLIQFDTFNLKIDLNRSIVFRKKTCRDRQVQSAVIPKGLLVKLVQTMKLFM